MLQKVTAGLQAGNYPDVAYVFGSDLANFARSDKLLDLTDSDKIDIDKFYPAGRESATVDGRVRAVPALIDNLAVVYNTKLFKEAGVPFPSDDWTWDDFRATAKQMTDDSARDRRDRLARHGRRGHHLADLAARLAARRRHPGRGRRQRRLRGPLR